MQRYIRPTRTTMNTPSQVAYHLYRTRPATLEEALARQEQVREGIREREDRRRSIREQMDREAGRGMADGRVTMYVFPRKVSTDTGVRYFRSKVFVCDCSDATKRAVRDTFGTDVLFAERSSQQEVEGQFVQATDRYVHLLDRKDRDVVLTGGRPEKGEFYMNAKGAYVSEDAFLASMDMNNPALSDSVFYESSRAFSDCLKLASEKKTDFNSMKIGWRERDVRSDSYREDCFPFIREGWFLEVSPETESIRICRQTDSCGVHVADTFVPNYSATGDSDRFLALYDGGTQRHPVSASDVMRSIESAVFSRSNIERCKSVLKQAGLYFKSAKEEKPAASLKIR